MAHWRDTMVDRPEMDGAVYVTGWTISAQKEKPTSGIANIGDRQLVLVCADIAANRLVPVLEEFNPGDLHELHSVYLGQGGLPPIRIRVFLDFLAQQIKIGEARASRHA